MNAKPFTRFAFPFLRVLLTSVLLLGLGPVAQPAPLAAPLAAVVADFSAAPTNGVATLTVDFTNTSSGSYTSSLWDFGDGGTSKKENPTYRYKTPGVYTVSLTVDGPDGTSTITKPGYITVCDSAYADFGAAPVSGVAPLAVGFTDRSCGAFSSWSWDFGDGSPAGSGANPAHTYSAGGLYTVTLTASGADGTATQTKTDLITVYDPVQADFTAQPTAGVAPLSVAFANASSGDYSSSEWDFGDGATSSEASPTHVYEAPGVYTVALTASGPGGTDTETKADCITVYTPVAASFSAAPESGPAPLSVAFTNTSTGDYATSEWDFGDGTTSADTDPAHVFTTPGVYTVTLTVSGLGGSDTAISPGCITVYTPVQAAFSATPTTGIVPLAVSFADASTGDYDSLAWDFGDGSPASSEANPTHTYAEGGVYTVTLTASGPGGTSVESKVDYITAYTPVQAGFSATPTAGTAPLTVGFTDLSTGDYTTLAWDFGDGSPISTEPAPVHTYASAGVYTVTLTVEGPGGTDTETKAGYITASSPVDADFAATPTTGIAPLSVAFTDLSTGDYATLSWDFGDGATSAEANPTHTYAAGGVYTVTLTASGTYGSDTEVKAGYITVYAPVVAAFSAEPTSGIAPLSVAFSNASTGDYTSLSWDFGDGSPASTETSPTHVYADPGLYTVTLSASGPGGTDVETKTGYVSVYAPVQAAFTAEPTSGIAPLAVTFSNASTGDYDYDRLVWDFGDGSPASSEANPTHTYAAGGVYTVTLTASGLGGTDSETKTGYVTVYTPVTADFSATPSSGMVPLTVTFTSTVTGDYSTLLWDLGDGTSTSEANPTHTYATGGLYTVRLTASGFGGVDVATTAVDVYTPVEADFEAAPLAGPAPLDVTFTNTSVGSYATSLWDFGDGGTSTLTSPTYTYTTPGTYTVTLTVEGPGGQDVETMVDCVTVYVPAQASFDAMPTSGIAPVTVVFTDTSTGDIADILWDFGDTITSTLPSPTHTYTVGGVYTPTLTVSGLGGTDVATTTIDVYTPVEAGFEAVPLGGPAPVTVTFTNTTTGDFDSSLWDFGDTITSTLPSPTHTYTVPGVYTPTLTVSGPGGTDVVTGTIQAYTPVVAGFEAAPTAGVLPLTVVFTNTTTGDFETSLWDFGDTITSTLASPVHLYNAPGLYTVSLTASGPGGTDTKVLTDCITVYPVTPAPGPWRTDVVLHNLGTDEAIAGLFATTAEVGGDAQQSDVHPDIPVRGSHTIAWSELAPSGAEVWAGSGVLRTTQPLAVLVPMAWDDPLGPRTAAVYAGGDAPATTAYLPWLTTGEGQLSQVIVQNTAGAEAQVTLRFYDLAGTEQLVHSATIPAGTERTFSVAGLEVDFATGGRGTATVTADQPVAVVGIVHGYEQAEAYAAWAEGATTLLAPGAVRKLNADGGYDWSEFVVQNPGDAASVHIEFVGHDGTVTHALDGSIPAHGGAAYSTEDLAELGDDWQGTVRATSMGGQPLTAVGVAWAPSSAVDNLAWNAVSAAAAGPLAFPAVYCRLAGADDDQWSAVLVHNASGSAGTLSVEFYDASGARVGDTYTVAVPAGGLAQLSLQDGLDLPQAALDALGTAFTGSMWVTPSAGMEIAGVAETVWPGEGRAAGYAGMAAP